jgi:hypothetical protein
MCNGLWEFSCKSKVFRCFLEPVFNHKGIWRSIKRSNRKLKHNSVANQKNYSFPEDRMDLAKPSNSIQSSQYSIVAPTRRNIHYRSHCNKDYANYVSRIYLIGVVNSYNVLLLSINEPI